MDFEDRSAAPAAPPIDEERWSLPARIAFRFAFVYLSLYVLKFPAGPIIPFTEGVVRAQVDLWKAIVNWVGHQVFQHGSTRLPILTGPTGSGDRMFDWLQVACFLVLSVVAALAWSVLDRRRPNYRRLYQWLRLIVRFSLAATMILYGSMKVIPLQMPPPSAARLVQRYGDSSPMGLLWTFIGASKSFQRFTGLAEMLGGTLLCVPRTTALGALLTFADMTMVFALNMCYDVPVKLMSFHMLLFGAFLIAPDVPRLVKLFLFHRTVALVDDRVVFARPWLNRGLLALQIALGTYLIGSNMSDQLGSAHRYDASTPDPASFLLTSRGFHWIQERPFNR